MAPIEPSLGDTSNPLHEAYELWLHPGRSQYFAMDNGGTKKERVGRTYAGVDGYCPFAVYLGSLGTLCITPCGLW